MNKMSKKTISLLLTTLMGVSVLFLFNNCGKGFDSIVEEANNSSTGGDDGTPGTPVIPGVDPTPVTAQTYFTSTVLPLYKSRCIACHVTIPTDAAGPPATDRIYTYAFAKQYALSGTNATNGTLYTKMLGTAHTGGNQCPGDAKGTVTPCKETKVWILKENPLLADGIAGNTSSVSITGAVRGWALDPASTATKIQVVVYVDGAFDGGGTMVGTYTADGAGSGVEDGHVFTFQLPATYLNGAPRKLYVYGKAATAANLIPNSPTTYTAFAGTAAGAATFTNLVAPKLVTCNKCHDWSTRALTLPYLVSPTPLNGGTATSNTLIDNAAGIAHAGGNFCAGGKNAEPCASLQKWWNDEGLAL